MSADSRQRKVGGLAIAVLVVLGVLRVLRKVSTPPPPAPAPTYVFPVASVVPVTSTAKPAGSSWPAYSAIARAAHTTFAIWSRTPIADATVARLAKATAPSIVIVPALDRETARPALLVRHLPGEAKTALSEAELKTFGVDLGKEEQATIERAKESLALEMIAPPASSLLALKELNALVASLAEGSGVIVDVETREIFSARFFLQHRVADWQSTAPTVARHTVIHFYPNGEWSRSVTLGMGKFGLPDLAIDDVSMAAGSDIGALTNLVCQRLVEGERIGDDGWLALDVDAVVDPVARADLRKAIEKGGSGKASVRLILATPQQGDADNRLLGIDFSREKGSTIQEQQVALITRLFGRVDEVVGVAPDGKLDEASAAARKRLRALHDVFHHGFGLGEELWVKAPFATDDGSREWMWVGVQTWEGETLTGTLLNEPHGVANLHEGATVTVKEGALFDYLHRLPDGGVEGGEVEALLHAPAQ